MEVLYERCCGLDIHKKTVVACVAIGDGPGSVRKQVRRFGTMTDDLLALVDWLAEQGVTHVAMESTGVYWKPVWNLLEGQFTLLLVNAQHMKQVPGRKTDVRDCEWIADRKAAWTAPRQLRAGSPPARTARADPLSDVAPARAGRRSEPPPEDTGRGEHQARVGGQ